MNVLGYIGSSGNIGVIQVRKGNKDDLISFIVERIEIVINENIIKDNNSYLELDVKYAFQDIMTATKKYLGKDLMGDIDDKDRIGNCTKTN